MKTGIDCMLGRLDRRKIKLNHRKLKFTCAHVFWSFLVNLVQKGAMTTEELMASAGFNGTGGGSEGSSGHGGCGVQTIYGYTGTSPPWRKAFTMVGLVLLLFGATLFASCGKNEDKPANPPIDRKDVYLPYDLSAKNNCDGDNNFYGDVLSESKIQALKEDPETGKIIPRVNCTDARGSTVEDVTQMVNHLLTVKDLGLTFEPDNMYVDDFDPADSIRAAKELQLSMTRGQEPPIVKKDVYVPYDLSAQNNCDGSNNFYGDVLSESKIQASKEDPETDRIIPRVNCHDAQGSTAEDVKQMVAFLMLVKDLGLTFEPDDMHVDDFDPADSIKAADGLQLMLTRENQPPQPPEKHNATVVYNRDLGPTAEELINAVKMYKDSLNVDTVFFEVLGDWSTMSQSGGVSNMDKVFYPVFELPVNTWGKGTFNTTNPNTGETTPINFSEEAKAFLLSKLYSFEM